jgi:hypothetical protein
MVAFFESDCDVLDLLGYILVAVFQRGFLVRPDQPVGAGNAAGPTKSEA